MQTTTLLGCWLFIVSCASPRGSAPGASAVTPTPEQGAKFGDDVAFLQKHTRIVVLQDAAGLARVAVAPGYQGRVMTSSAEGDSGASFGFLNRAFIAKGERVPHINVFGGEDRFWFGPEAGQYGLFFAPGDPYDLAHWQTPEVIDWGAWDVAEQAASVVRFSKSAALQNHSGTQFSVRIDRSVRVLERPELATALGIELPASLRSVGYASENTIENTGPVAWSQTSGLLSVWILGMFNPSPRTVIAIPFKQGAETELGPVVNDAYFGKVPPDRLKVGKGVLFFRGDGQERGKIGVSRRRALPLAGAYAAESGVLTLVQYTLPEAATEYVNSMWEEQTAPYSGDVLNSYNDGPPAPGQPPLGPFFEIETSSPAAALSPGAKLTHSHRTVHVSGPRGDLDKVASALLGASLEQIEHAFAP
jgi:hypothetical protein